MDSPLIQPGPPALLLVEGRTPQRFFEILLDHLQVGGVKVLDFGGVSQLRGTLKRVIDPVFLNSGRSLAVIRDAEGSAASAFQSVSDALKACGLAGPDAPGRWTTGQPALGVFILPDNRDAGMIEDVCIRALSESPEGETALRCAEAFLECLETTGRQPRKTAKTRLHVTLAGWGQEDPRASSAVRARIVRPEAQAMSALCEFLRKF